MGGADRAPSADKTREPISFNSAVVIPGRTAAAIRSSALRTMRPITCNCASSRSDLIDICFFHVLLRLNFFASRAELVPLAILSPVVWLYHPAPIIRTRQCSHGPIEQTGGK